MLQRYIYTIISSTNMCFILGHSLAFLKSLEFIKKHFFTCLWKSFRALSKLLKGPAKLFTSDKVSKFLWFQTKGEHLRCYTFQTSWNGSLLISKLLPSTPRALISWRELLSKQKVDLFLETLGFLPAAAAASVDWELNCRSESLSTPAVGIAECPLQLSLAHFDFSVLSSSAKIKF